MTRNLHKLVWVGVVAFGVFGAPLTRSGKADAYPHQEYYNPATGEIHCSATDCEDFMCCEIQKL